MTPFDILVLALILDALIGDPDWLWRRLAHPAALMGRAVAFLDSQLNTGRHKRLRGTLALALLTGLSVASGLALATLPGPVEVMLVALFLAQNSLMSHVGAVAHALALSLDDGRRAVSMIVGRDAGALDNSGVARSAIESAAENFSDGVVAPALWYLLLGLPGLLVYKMTNTADSMIGYQSEKYAEFGWAAARFDDLLNLVPARLAGVLVCTTHLSTHAFTIMLRDAPLHRSPNAGWPEAATAAVAGVAISGPRSYDGYKTSDPFVHAEGRHTVTSDDIHATIGVLWRAWAGFVLLIAAMRFLI